jgi:hypothetical protein
MTFLMFLQTFITFLYYKRKKTLLKKKHCEAKNKEKGKPFLNIINFDSFHFNEGIMHYNKIEGVLVLIDILNQHWNYSRYLLLKINYKFGFRYPFKCQSDGESYFIHNVIEICLVNSFIIYFVQKNAKKKIIFKDITI